MQSAAFVVIEIRLLSALRNLAKGCAAEREIQVSKGGEMPRGTWTAKRERQYDHIKSIA